MSFKDLITSGRNILQDIQSQGFVSGALGWFLGKNGDAEFSNVTIRGGTVIGGNLQSTNYVANTAGYKLNGTTGDADVNQLSARGTIEVGTIGGQRVDLKTASSIPRMELWTAATGETQPAFIANVAVATLPELELDSSDVGQGVTRIVIIAPDSTGNNPGQVFITGTNSTPAGIPGTEVVLDTAVTLNLANIHDVTLTSVNHAFQIGDTTAANIAMDNNEIMARSNGVKSTLFLNADGGNVQIGGGAATDNLQIGPTAGASLFVNFNQIWALNNGAASGLFLNFSSAGAVQVGNGTTAGADFICVAMRPVQALDAGPAAITATAFLASTPNITMPYPSSGSVLIHISARCNQAAAGQRGLMAAQIRDTNAAGAIRFAWNDNSAVEFPDTTPQSYGRTLLVTGLPTSGTMYIETGLRSTSGANSASFTNMRLVVEQTP